MDSVNWETDLEKTVFKMREWDIELLQTGTNPRGLHLQKESEYLQETGILISNLISYNNSVEGYTAGKNMSPSQMIKYSKSNPYFIRIAFQEDPDTGEYYIPWVSLKFKDFDGDEILDVGFSRVISSHPLDGQTTLRYLFAHQRILFTLDLGEEMTANEFVLRYHYPPIENTEAFLETKVKTAPFASTAGSQNQPKFKLLNDPDRNYEKRKRECGIGEWPPDFNWQPNWVDLLRKLLQPVNYNFKLAVSLYSIGPPCPAGPASVFPIDEYQAYWSERYERFIADISRKDKNITKIKDDAVEDVVHTVNYYRSKNFIDDSKKRLDQAAANWDLTLQKIDDILTSRFTPEKILQAVCICLTQLADDVMIEHVPGYEDNDFWSGLTLTTPDVGVGFDPALFITDLLKDADEPGANKSFKEKWKDASTEYGFDAEDWKEWYKPQREPFRLEKLCSFCMYLPDIFMQLPTFDLLQNLLDLLLDVLEALLTYLIMSLLLYALEYLFGMCPEYKCTIRPEGAAVNDFGAMELPNFFPDDFEPTGNNNILARCPALQIPSNAISASRFDEIQADLFQAISEEISSGQMVNMLEGVPSELTFQTIRDIILERPEFEDLAQFFSSGSRRKVEALVICIFENADQDKVANVGEYISSPTYCPTEDNTPVGILSDKCNNEDQVKKFLAKEKLGQYANLKGLIDGLRGNPNFIADMVPDIFNTDDTQGLFSDPKFKPESATTMIEQLNPYIDEINRSGVREGKMIIDALSVDGGPNRFMPNDDTLKDQSILQLAGSLTMLLSPLPAIAFFAAPNSVISRMDLDSTYPLVGGPDLKPALESVDNEVTFDFDVFAGDVVGLDDDIRFRGNINFGRYNYTGDSLRFSFEGLTPFLRDQENPFANNLLTQVSCAPIFGSSLFRKYTIPIPLYIDENGESEILDYLYDIGVDDVSYLEDASVDYSPQGKVFAKVIENNLEKIYSELKDEDKDYLHKRLSSTIHLKAFRNMMGIFAEAAANSPFFNSYVYEDIRDGVGSDGQFDCGGGPKPYKTKNFKRFGRRNPYWDQMLGPGPMFKQLYSASDANKRTKVYWKPVAAILDTPLRDGKLQDGTPVEYINRTQMKENIINNWDWAKKENLGDPNSLTSLNYAILDEVIPEMVSFYVMDTCLLATPFLKVFENYNVDDIQSNIFAQFIATKVKRELAGLFGFQTHVKLYWERVFKKGENIPSWLTEQPIEYDDCVEALINDAMVGRDDPPREGAFEKAAKLLRIKHLKEVDQMASVTYEKLFAKNRREPSEGDNPFPSGHSDFCDIFMAPQWADWTRPEDEDGLYRAINSPYSNAYTSEKEREKLEKGAFVFEGYIKVALKEKTIEYLNKHGLDELVGQLHNVPLSTERMDEIEIISDNLGTHEGPVGADDAATIGGMHPIGAYLNFIVAKALKEVGDDDFFLNSGLAENLEYNGSNMRLVDESPTVPLNGLFSSMKYGIRMNYVVTSGAAVEEEVGGFYAEGNQGENYWSSKYIGRQKSLTYKSNGGNGYLVFPIASKEYDSPLAGLKFNKAGNGTINDEWPTTTMDDTGATQAANKAGWETQLSGFTQSNTNTQERQDKYWGVVFKALMFTKLCKYAGNASNKNVAVSSLAKYDAMQEAAIAYVEQINSVDYSKETEEIEALMQEYAQEYADAIVAIKNGNPASPYMGNTVKAPYFNKIWFGNKFTQKELYSEFSQTKEWKAFLGYALPEQVAASLVSLYSYIVAVESLGDTMNTFPNTKILLKNLFLIAISRNDFSGKNPNQDKMEQAEMGEEIPPDPEEQDDNYEEPDEC